ncbi:hypothetical protein [Hydrococcus rivularis]|uniref:hypothetical protein n=1 Tax=Hydrococcus rivularis TaxID=1616834 RepID=UPI001114BE18|nr:hypothetical protein [Hydrococcus rivularis]
MNLTTFTHKVSFMVPDDSGGACSILLSYSPIFSFLPNLKLFFPKIVRSLEQSQIPPLVE